MNATSKNRLNRFLFPNSQQCQSNNSFFGLSTQLELLFIFVVVFFSFLYYSNFHVIACVIVLKSASSSSHTLRFFFQIIIQCNFRSLIAYQAILIFPCSLLRIHFVCVYVYLAVLIHQSISEKRRESIMFNH